MRQHNHPRCALSVMDIHLYLCKCRCPYVMCVYACVILRYLPSPSARTLDIMAVDSPRRAGIKWYGTLSSYHTITRTRHALTPCSSMSRKTRESRGREAGVLGEFQPSQCRKSIARDGPVLLLHLSLNQSLNKSLNLNPMSTSMLHNEGSQVLASYGSGGFPWMVVRERPMVFVLPYPAYYITYHN